MTVCEYLKKLNGIPENDELTAETLKFGDPIIDIFPVIEGASAAGICTWEINSGNLVGKRYFILENGGRAYVERETPLDDDIDLHCGKFESSQNVIEETISRLSSMHESNKRIEKVTGEPAPVDYEPRIKEFKDYLELINLSGKSSSSKK